MQTRSTDRPRAYGNDCRVRTEGRRAVCFDARNGAHDAYRATARRGPLCRPA